MQEPMYEFAEGKASLIRMGKYGRLARLSTIYCLVEKRVWSGP